MAIGLRQWAEQQLREVTEGGECTARIRFVTADGATWQTWDAPFPELDVWVAEAETLCAELAVDFADVVSAVFVAENGAGVVRAQLPKTIAGRGKRGGRGGGHAFGGQGAAPLHDMYAAQARTAEKTLQSANVQLEVLTRTIESQARAYADMLDYVRAQNEREALAKESSADVQQIVGQLLEQAPLLLELLKTRKPAPVSAAASAAKNAASDMLAQAAGDAAGNLISKTLKGTN